MCEKRSGCKTLENMWWWGAQLKKYSTKPKDPTTFVWPCQDINWKYWTTLESIISSIISRRPLKRKISQKEEYWQMHWQIDLASSSGRWSMVFLPSFCWMHPKIESSALTDHLYDLIYLGKRTEYSRKDQWILYAHCIRHGSHRIYWLLELFASKNSIWFDQDQSKLSFPPQDQWKRY